MINNPHRTKHEGYASIGSSSPISYASRVHSPGVSRSINLLPPRSRQYKSPNSTPTTSPMPSKLLSFDEVSQCYSDKKESKPKDYSYYLKQKIQIQEKRIQLLEEENKRLASLKIPENWEKELIKRNDDIRKLENQLKYFKELASEKSESDRLLDTIVEKENKISQLELEISELNQKILESERKIDGLNKENKNLLQAQDNHENCLRKEECEILLNQIQELEDSLEKQAIESKALKEENHKLKTEIQPGSLMYFSQDINKIRREMNKLARILEDFVAGKELTLKGLLGLDGEWKGEPIKQISIDIQSIKTDLNTILGIISDVHAEQCANIVCKTQ